MNFFKTSLLLAATTSVLQGQFQDMKAIGGLVGTSVSAFFLFAIAGALVTTLLLYLRKLRK